MATRYYLDGAEVVGKIRNSGDNAPGGGLAGLTSSAQGGSYGSGGVVIDDSAGTLDLKGWRPFYVTEDAATPNRIFTGFVGGRTISQSDMHEAPGTARVWDCDLMDLNVILGLKFFRTAAAKRPAETDLARIAWMLANWPAPAYRVYDNGGVLATNARNFDEADLRYQFPEEVLSNLAIDVRQFFLYWDETAVAGQEHSLWYSFPTAVRGTLASKLSNLNADVNGTTVFAALNGQSVSRDPAFTYSGLALKYRNGTIYRTNSTTATTYIDRDTFYETDRIGLLSTAESRAAAILDRASTEKDTVTCTVILMNADVNKIKEGYRIEVKFTHLPGYSTYTIVTIQKRTLRRPENGATDRWEVDLELSNQAPGSGGGEGGGAPGNFPAPAASAPAIANQYHNYYVAIGSIEWNTGTPIAGAPFTPSAGNVLIALISRRDAGTPNSPMANGWTILQAQPAAPALSDDSIVAVAKVSDGTEVSFTTIGEWSGSGNGWGFSIYELSDADFATITSVVSSGVSGLSLASGSVTLGGPGLVFGAFAKYWDSSVTSYAPGAGWTESIDDGGPAENHPHWAVIYQAVAAGSHNPPVTVTGNDNKWRAVTVGIAGSNLPPSPGQTVPWTVVVMSGAVGTTQYPYANGSLLVRVDGVLISTASYVETDPVAGTFTLSWIPDTDEVVSVSYLGR